MSAGRGLIGLLGGLAQASHPFPIAMVVSLTVLLGVASGPADEGRLILASLAMLLSQLSIGWSNDYIDREHDALRQPEKPVPSGSVPAGLLPPITVAALVGSFAVGALLGAGVLILLIAGTASGFAYNLFLKRTPLSWTAYVVAFALLPPYVWAALDQFREELWWLYPPCAPLAVAAHVANTLPDVESDREAGHGGLVVRLGRQRALLLLFGSLALPPAAIMLTLLWLEYSAPLLGGALVAYGALVGLAAATYRTPGREAARRGFRLIAPAAVLLAVGWVAAV
jgi:4-hydroxybenzoate polyprenyltransferase